MGTEDWLFKGLKLITNTKKQRLKIQSRGWIFKYTILKRSIKKKEEIKKINKKDRKRIIKKQTNKQKKKKTHQQPSKEYIWCLP